MNFKHIFTIILFTVSITLLASLAGCGSSVESTPTPKPTPEKIEKLVLVGPVGPMTIPLAYLVENNKLTDIASSCELTVWENSDQLTAYLNGNQPAHFITLPSNSSALFYNKGISIKMLDISVWGIQYVITSDPSIKSIMDLKGQEVVVPFKGNVPDLMFRYICQQKKIDQLKDLTVFYANTPQQAAQLMLTSQKKCAILPEPLATQVLMKAAASSNLKLYRSIDLQSAWGDASGKSTRIAIAGTIALPSVQANPHIIQKFLQEYALAIQWLKSNPEEAGILGAKIPQLGFEAAAVTESIKNTQWDFVQVKDCRPEIETFLGELSSLEPAIIGGKLPDDGLYYEGIDLK